MPPHPYPLPQGGEGRRKMKRFKQCPPSPLPSPAGWRGGEREKDFLKFICEFFNFSLEGKIKF
jgi:hypothetical protein